MKPLERELATMRGFAACRGDDECMDEADAELAQLRKIEEAAELACGLLWMVEDRREKVRAAFHALRDALGGPGSKGLGKAIQRAIDAGHEADHPPGADWWAGKKPKKNHDGCGIDCDECWNEAMKVCQEKANAH